MPAIGSRTRQDWEGTRRRGLFMRLAVAAAFILVTLVVVFAMGFGWFVSRIANDEVVLDRNADGIVVLTGGSARISDAIDLLASGRGRRLLITGVHPSTTQGEIARLMPQQQRFIACCVDLDHSAVNTVGNATETRRWAKERGFQSLIVVTSNYHMPRAMAELSHQLPQAVLVAFPVVTYKPFVDSPGAARLLFLEYVKYIFAVVRMLVDPAPSG